MTTKKHTKVGCNVSSTLGYAYGIAAGSWSLHAGNGTFLAKDGNPLALVISRGMIRVSEQRLGAA